jgi:hypothetical protein
MTCYFLSEPKLELYQTNFAPSNLVDSPSNLGGSPSMLGGAITLWSIQRCFQWKCGRRNDYTVQIRWDSRVHILQFLHTLYHLFTNTVSYHQSCFMHSADLNRLLHHANRIVIASSKRCQSDIETRLECPCWEGINHPKLLIIFAIGSDEIEEADLLEALKMIPKLSTRELGSDTPDEWIIGRKR